MKKLLTILLLLALVYTGCACKGGGIENVTVPSENVYDAEESAVIASKVSSIEDDENDIVVGTNIE